MGTSTTARAHTGGELKAELPGGWKEITSLINDILEAGVLEPRNLLNNSLVWPVRKMDDSRRLTVGYWVLNKVVPPTASAVLDMVSTIQTVQQAEGGCCSTADLAKASSLFWSGKRANRSLPSYGEDPYLLLLCCHGVLWTHWLVVKIWSKEMWTWWRTQV